MAEIDHDVMAAQQVHAPPHARKTMTLAVTSVVLVALLGAAFHFGRAALAVRAQAEAVAVEEETRAFCTGLGLAPASAVYQRCESGVATIRQRQEQRLAAESAGLL